MRATLGLAMASLVSAWVLGMLIQAMGGLGLEAKATNYLLTEGPLVVIPLVGFVLAMATVSAWSSRRFARGARLRLVLSIGLTGVSLCAVSLACSVAAMVAQLWSRGSTPLWEEFGVLLLSAAVRPCLLASAVVLCMASCLVATVISDAWMHSETVAESERPAHRH